MNIAYKQQNHVFSYSVLTSLQIGSKFPIFSGQILSAWIIITSNQSCAWSGWLATVPIRLGKRILSTENSSAHLRFSIFGQATHFTGRIRLEDDQPFMR